MAVKKCPYCGKPTEWKDNPSRPFCSERCKLIDFGAWANEQYSVPAEEIPPPLDETSADAETLNDGNDRSGTHY
ncbi:MAG: DNA gyrase inhibitor YacG [Pyrinomonadaceae bacterium]